MKTHKTLLLGAMLGMTFVAPSLIHAQIYTPTGGVAGSTGGGGNVSIGNNVASSHELFIEAPAISGQERLLRTRVADATNLDFLDIINGTGSGNRYYPVIWGFRSSYPQGSTGTPTISLMGSCQDGIDAEYSPGQVWPMMQFEVRRYANDPANSTSLPSGSVNTIDVRPLFDWTNAGNIQMRMDHTGNLGLGTSTGINSRLVVDGDGSSNSLDVQNAGTSALLVQNDGSVGISSTSPSARLEIKGAGSSGATTALNVLDNSSSTPLLGVQDNGDIRIGTTSFNAKLTLDQSPSSASSDVVGMYVSSTCPGGSAQNTLAYEGFANNGDIETEGGFFYGSNTNCDNYKAVIGVEGRAEASCLCNSWIYGVYGYASAPGGCGNSVYAGYFDGDVFCYTLYQSSDEKLKTNIHPLSGALDKLNLLQTKTFDYRTAEYPSMHLPSGSQMGLLAQDVERVFPTLVKNSIQPAAHDRDGKVTSPEVQFKSVNYTGLIPVLIQGIQEQQQQIETLKQQVTDLTTTVNTLTAHAGVPSTGSLTPLLYQNTPNPANSTTTIRYYLPNSTSQAELVVTDLSHQSEYLRTVVQSGEGQVELKAGTMPAGIYLYSLKVNGVTVDSKKMVVTP